jgi:hypothetical protein
MPVPWLLTKSWGATYGGIVKQGLPAWHFEDSKEAAKQGLPAFNCASLADDTLPSLPQLNVPFALQLRFTKVTDTGLKHLAGLNDLSELSLRDTKVENPGLRHLVGLNNLAVLSLHETSVTDAGMEHLRGLARLRLVFRPHRARPEDERVRVGLSRSGRFEVCLFLVVARRVVRDEQVPKDLAESFDGQYLLAQIQQRIKKSKGREREQLEAAQRELRKTFPKGRAEDAVVTTRDFDKAEVNLYLQLAERRLRGQPRSWLKLVMDDLRGAKDGEEFKRRLEELEEANREAQVSARTALRDVQLDVLRESRRIPEKLSAQPPDPRFR